MTKPFDLSELEQKLIDAGRPELKPVAKLMATTVISWLYVGN